MAAEDHNEAKQDYESGMKYREIAEKYGVSINTVKSWQKRFGWQRAGRAQKENRVHPKIEQGAPAKKKFGAPKGNKNAVGHGAPVGNHNAKGNKGGHGAPKGNQYALKHGLRANILPDDPEVHEIFDSIDEMSALDMLWNSIKIQMMQILRAQRLMYVRDQEDLVKHLKRQKIRTSKSGKGAEQKEAEQEWEFQYPWDRHGNFLQSLSRAMHELQLLIARYEEMSKGMKDEKQRAEIELMKAQLDKLKGIEPDEQEDDGFIEALKAEAANVWNDDNG